MESEHPKRMDHDAYHRMEDMFVEDYRAARDKLVFLRMAHIPFDLPADGDSDSHMHLLRVAVDEVFEVASVTPAFGSDRLIHQMYPHELVQCRRSLKFVYVDRGSVVEKSLRELMDLVIEDADGHE